MWILGCTEVKRDRKAVFCAQLLPKTPELLQGSAPSCKQIIFPALVNNTAATQGDPSSILRYYLSSSGLARKYGVPFHTRTVPLVPFKGTVVGQACNWFQKLIHVLFSCQEGLL